MQELGHHVTVVQLLMRSHLGVMCAVLFAMWQEGSDYVREDSEKIHGNDVWNGGLEL